MNTGAAGKILRLVSFDALLRKLRFDFSDTFTNSFYFDSINGTAWIENGMMRTDNLLVDGLEADIAMQGNLDLVKRQIDMEAVVAPEISASVGVATAFAINPVIGAAVFAASKVLGPCGTRYRCCVITSVARWINRKSMKCCVNRVKLTTSEFDAVPELPQAMII